MRFLYESALGWHTLTSKNADMFSRPEAPRTNIQSRVKGLVGAPRQHFPRSFLENRLHLAQRQYKPLEVFLPRDLEFRCAAV